MCKYITLLAISMMICAAPGFAVVSVVQDWSDATQFSLGWRVFTCCGSSAFADEYGCGVRFYASGHGYPAQADFYLVWVRNLQEGDVVEYSGKSCDGTVGQFSYFWTFDCSQISHPDPCPLYAPVIGPEVDQRSLTVPSGACGVVICAAMTGTHIYNVVDWVQVTVADHAEVVLPDYTIPPLFAAPEISDVPDDQGGELSIAWIAHGFDRPQALEPIVEYRVQRLDDTWRTIEALPANGSAAYDMVVATADVAIAGQTTPLRGYRVMACTADSVVFFASAPDSSVSIDNLPPAAPQLILSDTETSRVLAWQSDPVFDFAETCLYRDVRPDFEAGPPVFCSSSEPWYIESHLARYYYRTRSFDIHGNASEWSNEVIGRWPTGVPGVLPTALRLYPCQPNPFNPRTTIKYDLPEAGPVRLAVFDLAGRLVRTLVDENKPQGSFEAAWDGRDSSGKEVSSGTYLARLLFGGRVETARMGLVR